MIIFARDANHDTPKPQLSDIQYYNINHAVNLWKMNNLIGLYIHRHSHYNVHFQDTSPSTMGIITED